MNFTIHPTFKDKNRNKIFHCNICNSNFDWIIELTAVLALIAPLLLLFYYMPYLPEAVPVNFDLTGNPSAYGAKSSLTILPVIAPLLYVGLTWLSWKPEIFKYPVRITHHNVEIQYRIMYRLISRIKVIIQLFLFYLIYGIISTAINYTDGLHPEVLLTFLFLFLVTIGYYIMKSLRHTG